MFVQSGDDRYTNVDKMVLKEADVLPHGLINEVETKLGRTASAARVCRLASRPDHRAARRDPITHRDCISTFMARSALAFDRRRRSDCGLSGRLGGAGGAFQRLRRASPSTQEAAPPRCTCYAALRPRLRPAAAQRARWPLMSGATPSRTSSCSSPRVRRMSSTSRRRTLAASTIPIEALLLVRRDGLDRVLRRKLQRDRRSGPVSAHIAMACGADQVLAKPGMGVDEGHDDRRQRDGVELRRWLPLAIARRHEPPLADVRIIALEQFGAGPVRAACSSPTSAPT